MADMATHDSGTGRSGNGKLETRDYIYIGVYTVLYFVLIAIAAALIHAIPAGMPFMGFAGGVLGGIPYLLVAAKSRRFGAITIMGILLAVLLGVMHGNYYTVITAVIAAVAADLIARAGGYRNLLLASISAGVFNLWNIGLFLPFYIGRNSYLATLSAKSGAGYAARLAGLFPGWMLPVIFILGVLGGILGAWIATLVIRKHFERAGLI